MSTEITDETSTHPTTGETPNTETTETVTPDTQTPNTSDAPKTAEELQAELASLQAQLKRVNHESAERRKQLDAFEKSKREAEDAEKTELQKAQDELADANKKLEELQNVARRHTLLSAMRGAGQRLKVLLNDDALDVLFDAGHLSKCEINDEGEPQNVDAFLKDLIKAKPYILQNRTSAPDINSQDDGDKGKGEIMSDDDRKERARRFGLRV